ncbi:hypothetical protein J437_LFUL011074 [Ladona fulva]|uniref:Scavenger receptor class B member 1 n=1 Tax=Ladona fulva TaxID=123851 RepID=A0A8K0K909_LADFU|nr:hypothetical protein J437_LFUL011074 [Ladona fulva]
MHMKFPQWPWSTAADPLGAAWIWANLPSPRRKASLQRQSSHISEDEREQEKRREDRRRQSEQLESGEIAEAVAEILDRKRRVNVYLLVAGVISLLSSVLLWTVNPYDIIFRMKATLTENGETFGIWKKPPVDLYLKVFLFNITNKDAFLNGKEKLRVEEVGPYVYK